MTTGPSRWFTDWTLDAPYVIVDDSKAFFAEVEALRAFKASVPWVLLIKAATVCAQNTPVDDLLAEKLNAWLDANAPEAAK